MWAEKTYFKIFKTSYQPPQTHKNSLSTPKFKQSNISNKKCYNVQYALDGKTEQAKPANAIGWSSRLSSLPIICMIVCSLRLMFSFYVIPRGCNQTIPKLSIQHKKRQSEDKRPKMITSKSENTRTRTRNRQITSTQQTPLHTFV